MPIGTVLVPFWYGLKRNSVRKTQFPVKHVATVQLIYVRFDRMLLVKLITM